MDLNIELLNKLNVGSWVAEEESSEVKEYFHETTYWRDLINDDVDIIFGPKGSGKSALYTHLVSSDNIFFNSNVIIVKAEHYKGSPVFADLKIDPPATEVEFLRLWKLYFLILISETFEEYKINDEHAQYVRAILEQSGLITKVKSFKSYLKSAAEYVKKFRGIQSITPGIGISEITGSPNKFEFKVAFDEPDDSDTDKGIIFIDHLFNSVNESLKNNGVKMWIALDRLDAAFESSPALEKNALKSLFRVYLDILQYNRLRLKIFLRDDIWKAVIVDGFREYSHITRKTTIEWDRSSLFIMLMRRILKNKEIIDCCGFKESGGIFKDLKSMEKIFNFVFPQYINTKQNTFDWIISRTVDGKKVNYPRNLIQLIKIAKHLQLKAWNNGDYKALPNSSLVESKYLVLALSSVSQTQVEVLFSEYPQYRTLINQLKKKGPKITIDELKTIWNIEKLSEAKNLFMSLEKIGFFENVESDSKPIANIPIIYRPYLKLAYN